MKPLKSIVIGTAGHIDHGKTALVRALTGIDTDRLPEEKRRGITIDLGFASMDIAAADGTQMRISFVDVPGHALFIRNMLAGTGCVPAVMLVIAADEGVMPQTREHLAICELLGISEGVTVISKADVVSESQLDEIRGSVANFLKGTFLGGEKSVIVPVSAHSGAGLAELRAKLSRLAAGAGRAEETRPMRLPLDRTFVKKGFGTVVTGTLLSGEIHAGESLVLEPGTRSVRVRGLQAQGETEETAVPGSRVAVNLSGIDASEIARGQTLVHSGELAAVDVIDAEVTLLAGAAALKQRARVHFHAFTSEGMAGVSLYRNEPVGPGSARLVRLKLSAPIVLSPGDRFVLRQPLPAGTIGGGRVLDAQPLANARRAATSAWLEEMRHASMERQVLLRARRRGADGIRLHDLARELGVIAAAVTRYAAPSLDAGELELIGEDVFVVREALMEGTERVLSRLRSAGADGLKRSELRSRTLLQPEVQNAILERLVTERRIQLRGEIVVISGDSDAPSNRDEDKVQAVDSAYQAAGLAPLSVLELAQQLKMAERDLRRIITLLLRQRSLLRMGSDDVFIHTEALRRLAAQLASMRGKTVDVAAFKSMTGLTRKHAIPLLELLDRERITRKQGDQRVVL